VHAVSLAGFAIATLAKLYALMNLILGIFWYQRLAELGTFSVIVAVFFFGGVHLFVTGLLGEYILVTYAQVKKRGRLCSSESVSISTTALIVLAPVARFARNGPLGPT
jgi:polyisoprenyl-phosphate glycosyltransferase